jgi:hypothetical protein
MERERQRRCWKEDFWARLGIKLCNP